MADAAILVVDDDMIFRKLASTAFQFPGTSVETAADGQEGAAALALRHFDLVLVDVEMPRKDGLTLLREIRADPARAHTPVIVITGRDDPAEVAAIRAMGATDVICKPVNWRLLPGIVQKLLQQT